jgi:hypothetical protein
VGHPGSGCPLVDNNASSVAAKLESISLYLSDEPGDDASSATEKEPCTSPANISKPVHKKVIFP